MTTTDTIATPASAAPRVALVTGGSRGIGAAVAQRLAAEGHDIAITHRDSKERGEQVVAQVEALGRRAIIIQADAADADAQADAVRQTVEGLGRLDVVVANAGVFLGGPFEDLETFDRQIAVNVRGVFALAGAAAPHLTDDGRVVIMGSINADRAFMPGMTMYATSKAAVQGMVRGLARDLAAQGATANVVQPGPIDTEMNPSDAPHADVMRSLVALGRYGRAEEVAAVVSFLASRDASYVTGATIDVDGGMRA